MTRSHSHTTRRQFLAGTAGTAAVAHRAIAQDDDDDEDEEDSAGFTPFIPGQELATFAGQAASYVVDAIDDINPFTGPGVDEDSYTDLEARETHVEIYADAKEMAFYDEEIITNVENLLTFAPNKLYADAKFAAIEVHRRGGTLEEAKTAAREEITAQLVKTQKNVLDHWSVQVSKLLRMRDDIDAKEGLTQADVFQIKDLEWCTGLEQQDRTISLLDESEYTVEGLNANYDTPDRSGAVQFSPVPNDPEATVLQVLPIDSGQRVPALDQGLFAQAWQRISEVAESTTQEIEALLDGVYEQLDEAEYDVNDLISGADLAGLASDNPDSYAAAAADLAALNVPLADPALTVELPEANDGEGITYEGTLAITAGEDVELDVGTRYDPEALPGQVILAYNYRDEETDELRGGKALLTQPFRITSAVDPETGEELSTVSFSGRNQQTTDVDVDSLIEELRALANEKRKIEQQQREIVVGGGFFDGLGDALGQLGNSLPGVVVLLGGVYVGIRALGDAS